MKKANDLNERLTIIENTLPKYNSDIPSEQLVYNEKIKKIIDELNGYEQQIKLELNKKIKNILTANNKSLDDIESVINKVKLILKYTSNESDYLNTSGLDEIIYKISSTKDVDLVNNYIKDYLILMNKYGVQLDKSSFDYTYYTFKYMDKVYEYKDSNEYLIQMKKYFDEIYWICPNIIRQLVMCFLSITEKNKKLINKNILEIKDNLIKELDLSNININDYYISLLNKYYDELNSTTFNIFDYLKNNPDKLKKMISYKYDKVINSYIEKEIGSKEDEKLFIDNVKDLSSNLNEYNYLNNFSYLINYLKDIFNNKNINKYSDKELVKLNNKKDSISKLLFKLNKPQTRFGLFKSNEETINRKIRINNAYLISYVDEIYKLTMQGFIDKMNESISSLSINSNIYDALMIMNRNYFALTNIIEENTLDEIDKLNDFIYSRYTNISKNTSIEYYDDIDKLISQKYSLSNIKLDIDFEDENSILDHLLELEYLNLNYTLKNKNLSIKDIEICVRREQD